MNGWVFSSVTLFGVEQMDETIFLQAIYLQQRQLFKKVGPANQLKM